MSAKFEVNFQSLSIWSATQYGDDKAMTFYNKHIINVLPFSLRDNYRDKFDLILLLSSPDD